MKSFSSTSFAGDRAEALDEIAALLRKNPQALFTDFQWYLYQSRNTVFFVAYSEEAFTKQSLEKKVAEMVSLAPQLTHGFMGARPGQAFPQQVLEAVTEVETVDSFEGYPDKWLSPGLDIFEHPDLPLFRVKALVLRNGPDAEGRNALYMFRCSHALMEGSDSALLTRSQTAAHGNIRNKKNKLPFKVRMRATIAGTLSGTISMILAHTSKWQPLDHGFMTLALDRPKLRRAARKIGVSQRSLLFALVLHALNDGGKGMSPEVISTAYTMLDSNRSEADDDFFRVNTVRTKFEVKPDLVDFARSIDKHMQEAEANDPKKMQFVINAMFSTHRRWARLFPFLYGEKFFSYSGKNHIVLTMIPPHRIYGNLTKGLREPIYAGSWHPSSSICTFVPSREFTTLNFTVDKRHLAHVPKISQLLDGLDSEPAPTAAAG